MFFITALYLSQEMFLTKEESRISLIAAGSALLGVLIGSATGLWGTYAKFGADQKAQIKDSRYHAYTQLKGQQAEFLMLFQQMALVEDKDTLYQVREAQQIVKDNDRSKSQGQKQVDDKAAHLRKNMLRRRNSRNAITITT